MAANEYPSLKLSQDNELDCITHYDNNEICYNWLLDNIELEKAPCGKMLDSPVFPDIELLETSEWSIKIYFKTKKIEDTNKLNNDMNGLSLADHNRSSNNRSFILLDENNNEAYENKITIALVSHLRKEELKIHTPTIKIQFWVIDEKKRVILSNPLESIKFDGDSQEIVVSKIDKFQLGNFKDIILKFRCHLAVSNTKINTYKTFKADFKWVINSCTKFVLADKNHDEHFIESLKFNFLNDGLLTTNCNNTIRTNSVASKHRWSLNLYPNGRCEKYYGYTSIFIKHKSGPSGILVGATFKFIDRQDSNISVIKDLPPQIFLEDQRWGIANLFKRGDFKFSKYINVTCCLRILDIQTELTDSYVFIDSLNRNSLGFLRKLSNDYAAQRNCDITLRCKEGNDIKLHKIVLFTSSDKFEELAYKSQDWFGGNNLEIELPYSKQCVEKFVRYLYEFDLNDEGCDNEILVELLKLSIDYDVKILQQDCEFYLIKNRMSRDLVLQLIRINRFYLTKRLKTAILDYFKRNFKSFAENDKINVFTDDELLKQFLLGL